MAVLRIIALTVFIQIAALASTCSAAITTMACPTDDMEVTSPFGWRQHPIYGTEKYHCGVDLGVYIGDSISATADGVVVFAGDGDDGYGYQVIIDHGDGIMTRYGHNSLISVREGQPVRQGQEIALGGSTGNSTGPHCHLEVILNGEVTDPGNYIPGLKALEIEAGQTNGEGGGAAAPIPGNYGYDEHGSALDKITNTDVGKYIRDVIVKCVDTITEGLRLIRSAVADVFMFLLTIDIVVGAMKKSMEASGPDVPNDSFAVWIIQRVVLYGFLMVLLFNWGDIVGNLSLHGLPVLGAIAANSDLDTAGKILSDPTQIIQKGIMIIQPIMSDLLQPKSFMTGLGFTAIFFDPISLLCFVLWFIFLCLFIIIGIQLAIAYLEFYVVILFSFTAFMFSGLKYMRKYASNGLNGVFVVSINLMFYCLFATMLNYTMESIAMNSFHTSRKIVADNADITNRITNVSDLMARIRLVETTWGNYHFDNGSGRYGAYQINKSHYDEWCAKYEKSGLRPALDTDKNYTRYTESGPYNTLPEPTDTVYPWSQRNQDIIVRYILISYYNKYHSWEAAGRAWSQGETNINSSEGADYERKLLEVKGDLSSEKATGGITNLALLLQLLVVVLAFFFMGTRISNMIKKQFGTSGFKLTQEEVL